MDKRDKRKKMRHRHRKREEKQEEEVRSVYPQINIDRAKETLYDSVYFKDNRGIIAALTYETGHNAHNGHLQSEEWHRGALTAEERYSRGRGANHDQQAGGSNSRGHTGNHGQPIEASIDHTEVDQNEIPSPNSGDINVKSKDYVPLFATEEKTTTASDSKHIPQQQESGDHEIPIKQSTGDDIRFQQNQNTKSVGVDALLKQEGELVVNIRKDRKRKIIQQIESNKTSNQGKVRKSDKLEESESIDTDDSQYVGMACDLCDFMTPESVTGSEEKELIASHCNTDKHNSASKVNIIVHVNDKGKHVREKISVLHKSLFLTSELYTGKDKEKRESNVFVANTNTIVPQCPSCYKVFATIWSCAYHYYEIHDRTANDVYSLGNVTKEVHSLNIDTQCCTCHTEFPNIQKLIEHWETNQSHHTIGHTLRQDLPENKKVFYGCIFCGHGNFRKLHAIMSHIHGRHVDQLKTNKMPSYDIIANIVECTEKIYTVIPFCDSVPLELCVQQDNVHKKISNFKKYRKQK